jgi:ribosome biogenesis protein NSA1
MQLLDLRAPGKLLQTFTGFTGSITSIVCDPVEPLVATTSLDRFLRVHHLETKDLVYKVEHWSRGSE